MFGHTCYSTCVEVREQLCGISSLFPPLHEFWDQTQVTRLLRQVTLCPYILILYQSPPQSETAVIRRSRIQAAHTPLFLSGVFGSINRMVTSL